MKLKKKLKTVFNEEDTPKFPLNKKELAKLKDHYKNGTLKFNAKDIGEAILQDKDFRKGFLK